MKVFAALIMATVMIIKMVMGQSGYEFPASVEDYLYAPLVKDFTCEGLDWGYYADVANNCQVFHVCWPRLDDSGITDHWSFICGNTTIFDQATLTCNHESDAFPCEEAASLYGTVEWGKRQEEE